MIAPSPFLRSALHASHAPDFPSAFTAWNALPTRNSLITVFATSHALFLCQFWSVPAVANASTPSFVAATPAIIAPLFIASSVKRFTISVFVNCSNGFGIAMFIFFHGPSTPNIAASMPPFAAAASSWRHPPGPSGSSAISA